ncbi:HVA22-like protein F [Hibiscus syriacus]|uniref:HVA22-like protein F n=1 Tax=Hibiscus syriacus TaxID=106335 RepID=A0A6A3D2V7_HIBSY|nr:HVA22-like protein F [Hibiscus syriacus]
MRSIDVVKCWPFTGASSSGDDDDDDGTGKLSKQSMESLLPPITVSKFRWWSDELDLLKSTELQSSGMEKNNLQEKQVNLHVGEKSDERSDMLECPVCGAFAASTVNALNAHVDSCLAQASRQERRQMRMLIRPTKSRTPKKRSITDIFAVAPQIQKVDHDPKKKKVAIMKKSMNKRRKLKKKKNNKQNGLMIVNKYMDDAKCGSGSMSSDAYQLHNEIDQYMDDAKCGSGSMSSDAYQLHNEIDLICKENGAKLKLQTPVNFKRKANTLCNRGSNAIAILGKKPSLKCMSAKKKSKVFQASQLIVECEKPCSSIRGILKNQAKCTSGQNAVTCNTRVTTLASPSGIQHSVRHVSFSGKDDILGPHKKHVASFGENICHVDSDSDELLEKGHKNDDDKEFQTREINTSDDEDVSFSTENEIRVQDAKEKQLWPDMHYNADKSKFLGPGILVQEKANHFSNRSLRPGQVVLDSGNLHMSNQGNQTAFHNPPFAVAPRHFSAVKKIPNPFANSQVGGGVSTTLKCSSQFVDYLGDCTQEVVTSSSKANPRASLHPSSSGFALSKNANGTSPFPSQFTSQNVSGHALSHQLVYWPTPSELRGRLCTLPDRELKEVALREKCRDEEFFGLPLNSLGELVQNNSNGKGGFNQLKKPNPTPGSSNSINNILLPGSSNSINNLLLPRGMDDHSIMKEKHFIECSLPNYLFPAQNHMKGNATVHLSARLGAADLQDLRKDGYFTNSDRRGSRFDCLVYSDVNPMNISFSGCGRYDQFRNQKEKDMSHATKTAEKMLLNSATPTMRLMGKDVTVYRSSDERQGFADAPKSTALQSSCVNKHFQQEWLLDSASGMCNGVPVQQFEIMNKQAFPSNALMKPLESNFFKPSLNWQANPEFRNSSSITIAQDPCPISHHLAHPHTSHVIFDNGADSHEPFLSRTEALRVTSRQPAVSASHRNYQNINGYSVELENNQNLPNAGRSSFNFPFLHPDHVEQVQPYWCPESSKSLIPWLLQATQQVQAPSTPSQLFPDVGGRHCLHTAQTSSLMNRSVPRFPIVSYDRNPMISYSQMEISSGQPSLVKPTSIDLIKEDYLMNPMKVTNLGIRDESRAATRLTEASFGGWIPNESQCTGFRLSAGIDSSNVDSYGVTRLSPIKLSPGVKHILQPNQNVDPDNSRLIHSTIPFASLTESGNTLETRKKSTKIYRF